MRKIISCILIIFICLPFANAGSIIYDQDTTTNNFKDVEVASQTYYTLIGNSNNQNLGNSTGDLEIEYFDINTPTFIVIDNNVINNTIQITWFFENNAIATNQELILNEVGLYYFEIDTSFDGEDGTILINAPNSSVLNVYSVATTQKGINTLFTPMINATEDLILINISFWKVIYYIFISGIVLFVVTGLFSLAFNIMDYSKKLRKRGLRKDYDDDYLDEEV